SLGTGVAVKLASERNIRALILEAPYTSILEVASKQFPMLPLSFLLKDTFHSDERIGQVKAPVLIMHGDQDETIPISFGQALYYLIRNSTKKFVVFHGKGHIDFDDQRVLATVHAFLKE
ncbi:MAG: alpha/beta hydrolase, partial [Xanthobacteraceae bacterium]